MNSENKCSICGKIIDTCSLSTKNTCHSCRLKKLREEGKIQ